MNLKERMTWRLNSTPVHEGEQAEVLIVLLLKKPEVQNYPGDSTDNF